MKTKIISLSLILALALSTAFCLTGCGDKDFPVDVANFTIEQKPQNVVILDPNVADIVSYMGYDSVLAGRSDEVDQEWLSVAPSVGSASNPDIEKIKNDKASIVFANETLNKNSKETLENNDIRVITMEPATTAKQLEANYKTIGKILGGTETGAKKGESSYKNLISSMDKIKESAYSSDNESVLYTICYLYSVDNQIKIATTGSYVDMLLSYTGAVNTAVNIEDDSVDSDTLKIANPNYIFYDDEKTLDLIKKDKVLKDLSAVKNKKAFLISQKDVSRQGQSSINTLQKMVSYIYPDSTNTTDKNDSSKTESSTTEVITTSVANDYKIKIDDKLSLKPDDDNDNVKAMQKRLYDLGYITDKDNVTGYYGDVSKSAVKSFQKNNSIKETGTADNQTLVAIFNSDAVKAK